jgi:hypothetical protein
MCLNESDLIQKEINVCKLIEESIVINLAEKKVIVIYY